MKLSEIIRPILPNPSALFTNGGIVDEWKNCRFKGSQTEFVDTTGVATLLGNSVLEHHFANTSSCMTCHRLGGNR